MRIIVATHNEGKLVEINRILEDCLGADADQVELVSAGSLNLPDPVEDGVTFQENALLKARDVAARTGCPAVADDSGLIVDVMGNAPAFFPHVGRASMAMTKPTTRCCSRRSPTFRMPSVPRVSVARPRWWCRKPKQAQAPMVVMRSLRKSWKPAKCRACCCMSLMASMDSATTRCSCPTISRRVPSKPARSSRPRRWNRPKERHLPSRQGVARPAAIRGHSAEVGLKRVAAVSIRRSARCSKGVEL